jgi:hypothetical protein
MAGPSDRAETSLSMAGISMDWRFCTIMVRQPKLRPDFELDMPSSGTISAQFGRIATVIFLARTLLVPL